MVVLNQVQLNAALEQIYCCIDGPPRAYFELPIPEEGKVARFIYTTVNVAMSGEADLNQGTLCGWAWSKLQGLITSEQKEDHSVLLFWRSRPSIAEFLDDRGRVCTALRMRLVIPGVDLSSLASTDGRPLWL